VVHKSLQNTKNLREVEDIDGGGAREGEAGKTRVHREAPRWGFCGGESAGGVVEKVQRSSRSPPDHVRKTT
jgi:hypothetical protein